MQQSRTDVGDGEACDEIASSPEPVARIRYGCQHAGLVGQGRGTNVLIHEGGAQQRDASSGPECRACGAHLELSASFGRGVDTAQRGE